MNGRHPLFLLSALLAVVFGCSTASLKNVRIDEPLQGPAYRYTNIAPGENNTDSLFVILTFSGGGTRAAAFSYGVLEKLRETEIVWQGRRCRLLDEVDLISSVSGGSLTSAYYCLHPDRIFEDYPDRVLYADIQGSLIKRLLTPASQAKLLSPGYSRGDLMADQFHKNIFEEKTFSDLVTRNRRPFLIINATDMSRGRRFIFTQAQFDRIGSDLGKYPIAYAVAASAAFPGLLSPVTLENYRSRPEGEATEGKGVVPDPAENVLFKVPHGSGQDVYAQPGHPYLHLIDGGISDNLGLLPVIWILNNLDRGGSLMEHLQAEKIRKVVVISVNARVNRTKDWDSSKSAPGATKTLNTASTAPMNSFSQAQIEYVKLLREKLVEEQALRRDIEALLGAEVLEKPLQGLDAPEIDFYFMEVAFHNLKDGKERDYLNQVPTSFKLSREQVDRLRSAAGKALEQHQEFRSLLNEIGTDN